ncbi:MAG: hypothetical protein N2109_09850 [Fimbriimonadales bacterium]|nr:hypothetical protein [Fimbriimonadales bacterium]
MPRRRRSAAWLLSVGPPLAVAAWGGWLQSRCLLELARYRGPVDTAVPAGRSHIRLLADRVELDWTGRRLEARGLQVRAADGSRIASAEGARLVVGPWGLAPVRAELRGLRASLERLPDGRWRHQELFETERREPSDVPFELRVQSAVVSVRDRARTEPLETTFVVRRAVLRSLRDAFLASAEAEAPGLILSARAVGSAARWSLEAELKDLDVARWLGVLRGGPEARLLELGSAWSLEGGRASGRLLVESSEAVTALFDGDLRVRNLRHDRRAVVSEGRFRGAIGSFGAAGRLELGGRGWSARGDAVVRWRDRVAAAWSGKALSRDDASLPAAVG